MFEDKVLAAPEDSIFILSLEEGKEFIRLSEQIKDRLSKTDDMAEQEKAYLNFTDEHPGDLLMYIIVISTLP
jgi:hypothetical protein